jgi:hypothetical protein
MTTVVRFHCGHEIEYPVRIVASADVRFYWAAQSTPNAPGSVASCLGCATPYRPTGEFRTVVAISS